MRVPKFCSKPYCRSVVRDKGRVCCKCRKRAWREKNPLRDLYCHLRSNARQRGKVFTLTFEEFADVAQAGGYADGHGRSGNALHVDRIDPLRGYEAGNIRIIEASENCRKAYVDRLIHRGAFTSPLMREALVEAI